MMQMPLAILDDSEAIGKGSAPQGIVGTIKSLKCLIFPDGENAYEAGSLHITSRLDGEKVVIASPVKNKLDEVKIRDIATFSIEHNLLKFDNLLTNNPQIPEIAAAKKVLHYCVIKAVTISDQPAYLSFVSTPPTSTLTQPMAFPFSGDVKINATSISDGWSITGSDATHIDLSGPVPLLNLKLSFALLKGEMVMTSNLVDTRKRLIEQQQESEKAVASLKMDSDEMAALQNANDLDGKAIDSLSPEDQKLVMDLRSDVLDFFKYQNQEKTGPAADQSKANGEKIHASERSTKHRSELEKRATAIKGAQVSSQKIRATLNLLLSNDLPMFIELKTE